MVHQPGNLFHPRSFSTDWEVMVFDKLARLVPDSRLEGFAGQLSDELNLDIKTDDETIEFALGINVSFAQIWKRIESATDRASQLVREWNLECCPAASHPEYMLYNAAHIHIGTLLDEEAGVRLENSIVPWIPVFVALAANSPLREHRGIRFKSNRVRDGANWCVSPPSMRDPRTAQWTWGTDGGPKLFGAPTFEVRVTDCASSRRFLAELATFVAAFVHTKGTEADPGTPDEALYLDYLCNRWAAARDGMQATFRWNGATRSVGEIVDEMLDYASDGLSGLGCTRGELGLIELMRTKRLCQADLVLDIATRYSDPVLQGEVLVKRMRDWDAFDTWAGDQAPLEPRPAITEEEVLSEHARYIGEGEHFYNSRLAMTFPGVATDRILEQLIERGRLTRTIHPRRGMTLSRIA